MTDTIQPTYQFRLDNGLNSDFTPAPTWQIKLFSEIPFMDGEPGRFQAAANHLIEHAVMLRDDKLFERGCTRLNIVRFSLYSPQNTDEAKESLNRLGRVMTHPKLHHLDAERERVFEEWAGARSRIEHDLINWGSITQASTRDNMDPQDPNLTREQALHFLNRQADWTRAFTEEELRGQMMYLLGAKHLMLEVKGPISPPAFYRMLKQSEMAGIPEQHSEATQIVFRDVPATTDYARINTTTVRLPLTIPTGAEEAYQKDMQRVIEVLRQDKNIGLYWVRKEKADETTNWFLTITTPKENLMKGLMWGHMLSETMSQDQSVDSRLVWHDILLQSKDALRRNDAQSFVVHRNGGRS